MLNEKILYTKFNSHYLLAMLVDHRKNEIVDQESFKVPDGLSVKLAIQDRDLFYDFMEDSLKKFTKETKVVRHLLPEEIILVKNTEIEKAKLKQKRFKKKKNPLRILAEEVNIPFDKSIITSHVIEETESSQKVLLVAINREMVDNDIAIFKKIGFHNVSFGLPITSLYNLHIQDETEIIDAEQPTLIQEQKGQMIVSVSDLRIILSVFDQEIPIIFITEKLEDIENKLEYTALFIDRYIHFYKHIINRGKQDITGIKIINCTTTMRDGEMKAIFKDISTTIPLSFYTAKGKVDPKASQVYPLYRLLYGLTLGGDK